MLAEGEQPGGIDPLVRSLTKQGTVKLQLLVIGKEDVLSPRLRTQFSSSNLQCSIQFLDPTQHGLDEALAESVEEYIIVCNSKIGFVENALREISEQINDYAPAVLYFFENLIDASGYCTRTIEKPKWSPARFRQRSFLGNSVVFQREFCRHVGGFGDEIPEISLFEMVLKISEHSDNIVCVESGLIELFPLRVEAQNKDIRSVLMGRKGVVERHLSKLNLKHKVELATDFPGLEITRTLDRETPVSVIIPTRGSSAEVFGRSRILIIEAIRSLISKTSHANYEIVVVADLDTPSNVMEALGSFKDTKFTIVPYDKPFNFSEKCNLGALHSTGEVLVFLNDDVEIQSDDFLERIISPLEEQVIGQVGIMMHFEDGTIQHAGHAYSHGQFMHVYSGKEIHEISKETNLLMIDREVSGLTAACVAVRKSDFYKVGGFSEFLPGNFNDVDFSLKMRLLGKNNLLLHDVSMIHFESKTRVTTVKPGEVEFVRERWGYLNYDPYFTQDDGLEAGF